MWLWALGVATLYTLLKEPRKVFDLAKGIYNPGSFVGQSWAAYAAKKYGQDFIVKAAQIAHKYGLTLGELLSIFYHESGISSKVVNWLGCVGLIQFCPDYLNPKTGKVQRRGCSFVGKTADQIKAMKPIDQLDLVDLYFYKWTVLKPLRKGHEAEDINMLIFHPARMGRPDKYSKQDKTYLAGYYKALENGRKPGRVGI